MILPPGATADSETMIKFLRLTESRFNNLKSDKIHLNDFAKFQYFSIKLFYSLNRDKLRL